MNARDIEAALTATNIPLPEETPTPSPTPPPVDFYAKACTTRDRGVDARSPLEAIADFERANCFQAFYAIGEIYQHGIQRPYNGTSIRLDADHEKAIEYYLKAYEKHGDQRITVSVMYDNTLPSDLSGTFDLAKLNTVLQNAKTGHAEALFQLALFYKTELTHYENRTSHISAMPGSLNTWRQLCLEAAADLLHPHAAYQLMKEFGDKYTIETRLRYSLIAADPHYYKSLNSDELITFRGPAPLQKELVLMPVARALPTALTVKQHISPHGNMAGLFANSVVRSISIQCVLPDKHATCKGASVSNETTKATPEDMRAARLKALTGKKRPAESEKTITLSNR
jgi:TPR repeat protein